MERKKKASGAGQRLENVTQAILDAFRLEQRLMAKNKQELAYPRDAASLLTESIAYMEDVIEQIHTWENVKFAAESLSEFSRLGLSATLYLLKEHYMGTKAGDREILFVIC